MNEKINFVKKSLCLLTVLLTWNPDSGQAMQDSRSNPEQQGSQEAAPFRYVSAKAFYILPETHNNQSGYFSLSEGLDGNLQIGTAAYGRNAYLVEFDPANESQRIVLDTNKVCGLTATGFAAQAKIHTRNFVGPSGIVYVGSKQGYRLDKNDRSEYPGGYFMTYDPRNGRTGNRGMPFKGQGIADVSTDETNGLSYLVTCEDQHWMKYDSNRDHYQELGPLLTPYATTLIGANGHAYAVTSDFQLASFDPESSKVRVRPIHLDGKPWKRKNNLSIPTWVLTADQKRAYLILLNDATLFEIELTAEDPVAKAISHGPMIEGTNPDCRCGLDRGADGNVYAVIRVDNKTGFGKGFLHHLVRFNPTTGKREDLGVLKVANPGYFDWDRKDEKGQLQKWIHGFHRLPDGALTPLHAHMSLKATADNTIYITVIYPFTLLKIDEFRIQSPSSPARQYLSWAERSTFAVEKKLPRFSEIAERIADRHQKGGLIGFPFVQQAIAQDLHGRSGGLVHIGFDRPWKTDRTDQEKRYDVALVGYETGPGPNDAQKLRELKERGVYIVGFGPRSKPLQEVIAVCDAWFDTGLGETDRIVTIKQGSKAGRGNIAINAIQGWTLIAEVVGALTRKGRMPTIWKGYAYDDGREWGEKYFRKKQFHDDYRVPPLAKGELGRRFLTQIRYPIRRLRRQHDLIRKSAQLIDQQIRDGRKIFVAWQGHMPPSYIGKGDDADWARAVEFHPFLQQQVDAFSSKVPDSAFVLNLGYHGIDPVQANVFRRKSLQVVHFSGGHPSQKWRPGKGLLLNVDLGYAFGDSCVSIDGYPLCLFAPSGIAQVLAYEAIQTELAQLRK